MVLFSKEVSALGPDLALERFWDTFGHGDAIDPPEPFDTHAPTSFAVSAEASDLKAYTDELVIGVSTHQKRIDALIQRISQNWRIERMAIVDRNILRVAVHELTKDASDVPRKVAINEALEVAKRFGTAESGSFINGILDRVGK